MSAFRGNGHDLRIGLKSAVGPKRDISVVERGGVASTNNAPAGPIASLQRRYLLQITATYVGRIRRGENPGELPVQAPTSAPPFADRTASIAALFYDIASYVQRLAGGPLETRMPAMGDV